MKLSTFLGIAALFFYIVSWFSYQDTGCLWGFGIALPWLSLIASIPINLLQKTEEDCSGLHWAYTYVIMTVVFAAVAAIVTGSLNSQIPHIAACVCFIAEVSTKHRE
jgi:hypothetical protein